MGFFWGGERERGPRGFFSFSSFFFLHVLRLTNTILFGGYDRPATLFLLHLFILLPGPMTLVSTPCCIVSPHVLGDGEEDVKQSKDDELDKRRMNSLVNALFLQAKQYGNSLCPESQISFG